jgi:hypothetical protein
MIGIVELLTTLILTVLCTEALTDNWGQRTCAAQPIEFKYNDSTPYTYLHQQQGIKPFRFGEDCLETQECLGVRDDTMWNLRTGGPGSAFLIFENTLLPDLSPPDGQSIIDSGFVLFDEHSVMHIQGVGTFVGASGIGSYLAIPHQVVSGIVKTSDYSRHMKIIDRNRVVMTINRLQEWKHLPNETHSTTVRLELTYYPCSVKIKTITMELTEFTLIAFSDAAIQPGAKEDVCTRLMENCVGEHQQFDSYNDCMDYMNALPLFDPICQHKIGPMAVQGNCYMCKYLHNFMTPFEPELHCYHAGKGQFDVHGHRKCVPTDCYDENTPDELVPELLYYPPEEVTKKTIFELNDNGTWAETYVSPLADREHFLEAAGTCTADEAANIAAGVVLSLPFCMTSLSAQQCSVNCTQAVQTYLGRFAENGAICRCNSGNDLTVMESSVMLSKLHIDAKVLLEFCSRTLSTVDYPGCLGELDSYTCPQIGTYRGRGACFKWDYHDIQRAVYRDWGKEARFLGRVTQTDYVASAECNVLSIWEKQVKTDEQYYARFTATGTQTFSDNLESIINVHPSLGSVELNYSKILDAMKVDQVRDQFSLMSESCYFGSMKELHPVILNSTIQTVMGGLEQLYLLPPAAYSTDSELHVKGRKFVEKLFPGLWGTPEPGHTYTEILDRVLVLHDLNRDDLRNNMVKRDIEKVVREVIFRAMLKDELPYVDSKLGDDLTDLNVGALFRPGDLFVGQGVLWPTGYMSAKYQLRRHLRDSGVLDVDRLEGILEEVGLSGLIAVDGVGGAYDYVAGSLIGLASTQTAFSTLIERMRWDECEMRPLWNDYGGTAFLMEHMRLNMDVPGFIMRNSSSDHMARMFHLHGAHLDPNVFEDPFVFNPGRVNLDHGLYFNGQEKDFLEHMDENGYVSEEAIKQAPSLRRWCPGRHLSLKLIVELAPIFFPPRTDNYECHGGMRARYGVKFDSQIVTVHNGKIQLEVLKAKSEGKKPNNLMILLNGEVDVPVGWAKFIEKMRETPSSNPMDYWVLVMPGVGGKGTRLESCRWPLLGEYIADFIKEHAKKKYDRVYLFGRGASGTISYYAAHYAGIENLHGVITHSLHPAVYERVFSRQPLSAFYKTFWLDPQAELIFTNDGFPLEVFLSNQTWWNQAWEWDFRQFWKKTGARQIACLARDSWRALGNGYPGFNDPDEANKLDPDMHIFTISHEFSKFHPESLLKYGVLQTTPRRGIVNKFKQVRDGPDEFTPMFVDEPTEALAYEVHSFVDQTIGIDISLWSQLIAPPDLGDSAYIDAAKAPTIVFYVVILTVVIMTTGIVAELTLGKLIVEKLGFDMWIFAQIFAVPINFGCFLAATPITIPLYTCGLFKFGYPEVTSNLIAPVTRPDIYDNNLADRLLTFLSGCAYVVHHSGGTMIYLAVSLEDMEFKRLGLVALAVGMQHLCTFIKYRNNLLHVFIILGLEIWFQFEAFYVFTFATLSVKIGLWGVVLSHYIWFIQAVFVLIMDTVDSSSKKDEDKNDKPDPKRLSRSLTCHTANSVRMFEMPSAAEMEADSDEDEDDNPDKHRLGSPTFPIESKSLKVYQRLHGGQVDKPKKKKKSKGEGHTPDHWAPTLMLKISEEGPASPNGKGTQEIQNDESVANL